MVIIQVLADEQKKLHPDCWKRKRSLSSANQNNPSTHSTNQSPIHHVPQSPGGPMGHNLPQTPTSQASTILQLYRVNFKLIKYLLGVGGWVSQCLLN